MVLEETPAPPRGPCGAWGESLARCRVEVLSSLASCDESLNLQVRCMAAAASLRDTNSVQTTKSTQRGLKLITSALIPGVRLVILAPSRQARTITHQEELVEKAQTFITLLSFDL